MARMTIFTVQITGVAPDPEVYGGLDAARSYIGGIFAPAASAWLALLPDDQGRTLVTATRYLDEQPWDGAAIGTVGGAATTLQFPRTGLTRNGVAVDVATVPPEVVQAAFELAVLISAKPAVVSSVDQGTNLKSVSGGGGVGASFFAPTSAALGTAPVMPVVVQRLVGRFLAAPGDDGAGGFGSGGGTRSEFSRRRQFRLTWPEE